MNRATQLAKKPPRATTISRPLSCCGDVHDRSASRAAVGLRYRAPEVKSPENFAQFIAGNPDTAVAYVEAHLRAAAADDEHATAARRVADGALSAGSTLPRPGAGPPPRSPQQLPSDREVAAAWLLCVFIAALALGATSGLHNSEPPADTLTNRTAVRWHTRAVCTPPLPCAEGDTAILEPW